jgi:4-amino-4-deoxy-L-arabinose transferase-like glycosyltransferase
VWQKVLNVPGLLGGLAIALVGLYAGVLLVLVGVRLGYPFELDFIEGGTLAQAWRMARGLPVWLPPNREFVPYAYTPLFAALAAIPLPWTGPVLWPLRLISVLATGAAAVILWWVGRRLAGALLGVLCAGLFLAGYDIVGGWYDLARVDSLFMALALGGMALAADGGPPDRAGAGHRWSVGRGAVAAVLLALAFFTKQTALGFAVAVAVWVFVAQGWRAGVWFSAVYGALLAAGIWALSLGSAGAFGSVVLFLATAEPIEVPRLVRFVTHELLGRMPPLLLLLLYAAWQSRRAPGAAAWLRANPWLWFALVALLLSALQRARPGGALNSLLPLYTLLCLAPALAWAARPPRIDALRPAQRTVAWLDRPLWRVVMLLIVGQLLLARYDPRQHYPTPAMRAAGEHLVARIAHAGGPVWVVDQPSYNLLAGQEPAVSLNALYAARHRAIDPLPPDLVEAIEQKAFAFILTSDSVFALEPAFAELLHRHYVETEQLPPSEAPATLNGMPVRSYRRLLPF